MFLFLFLLNLTTLLTLLKKLPSVLILESLWFSTKALQLGKTADWQAPTLSPWTSPSAGPVILNLESVHQIEPGSFHPRLIKSSRPTPQESKVFFYIHKYKKSYWVTTLKSNSHVNIQSCLSLWLWLWTASLLQPVGMLQDSGALNAKRLLHWALHRFAH